MYAEKMRKSGVQKVLENTHTHVISTQSLKREEQYPLFWKSFLYQLLHKQLKCTIKFKTPYATITKSITPTQIQNNQEPIKNDHA